MVISLLKKIAACLPYGLDHRRGKFAFSRMRPYNGPRNPGVDTTTLKGKVMCGYQGWFNAKGDGSGRGWVHFGRLKQFRPGNCAIDLWPDMDEMDIDEKYPTTFEHADGQTAHVFSSYNRKTVLRHFQWMRDYGIDGTFLQRFGNGLIQSEAVLNHQNKVLLNVQAGANLSGRTWAIMYDLSRLNSQQVEEVIVEDWKQLFDRLDVTRDQSYLSHNGKPVVAIWGVGFNDGREYSLEACEKLVGFFKADSKYGNNTVLLGIPAGWRELNFDAVRDDRLHRIISQADIVSPWTVGRYATPQSARLHAKAVTRLDVEWTKRRKIDYLPVVFPGFSWKNRQKTYGQHAALDQIPRKKGDFLWSQGIASIKQGAEMIYLAMFDELDEGTAIFKCTNDPPVGESQFVTFEGLPSDHYLWLTGKLGEVLRGGHEATQELPVRGHSGRQFSD